MLHAAGRLTVHYRWSGNIDASDAAGGPSGASAQRD